MTSKEFRTGPTSDASLHSIIVGAKRLQDHPNRHDLAVNLHEIDLLLWDLIQDLEAEWYE